MAFDDDEENDDVDLKDIGNKQRSASLDIRTEVLPVFEEHSNFFIY